ncbi:uroporphyrinogen decarboxylase [Nitzschia inconspicua]|uniref:Uroporphyrinogen decarboxylase n=1 Tax=Nitzschia inconspicua TaxID=303405 RepID=A0A9K3LVN7_9STRA|nr:uroporphyrinogen decarboxylase [Nitzschia inconspicua]
MSSSSSVAAPRPLVDHNDDTTRNDPLLLRAARGEDVERFPVWMMRQAGRHMQAYRNLLHKYPTFRERSEIPEASKAISLQPLERYGVDGVILFSDILTPLPAMGIDFDILENGRIHIEPIRNQEQLDNRLHRESKEEFRVKCSFVGKVLKELRQQFSTTTTTTSPDTTLLGFVGLPFTLASYLVEGETGVSTGFPNIHRLMKDDPKLVKSILSLLSDNIVQYACFQIESGAQVLQVFDSWAGHVNDEYYAEFCQPYQQRVIRGIHQHHPHVPVIIYIAPGPYSKRGRRLEVLAQTGADIISVDYTVDMALARALLSDNESIGLQGNLDPELLRNGPLNEIRRQTLALLKSLKGKRRCIINLGHGISPDTPEAHAKCFVETVQSYDVYS